MLLAGHAASSNDESSVTVLSEEKNISFPYKFNWISTSRNDGLNDRQTDRQKTDMIYSRVAFETENL